jgi:hypothetical protein
MNQIRVLMQWPSVRLSSTPGTACPSFAPPVFLISAGLNDIFMCLIDDNLLVLNDNHFYDAPVSKGSTEFLG